MKASLTIVSATGQFNYAARYLSEKDRFDVNVLLLISYKGGVVAEQILTSPYSDVFDEIVIFEPAPDSTHGINKEASRRTCKKFSSIEKNLSKKYKFDSIFYGVVAYLPVYNFIYTRMRDAFPEAETVVVEDGTATYLLNDKKLFRFMAAPVRRKLIKLAGQFLRRDIGVATLLRFLVYKVFGYVPRPVYASGVKYSRDFIADKFVVSQSDLLMLPPKCRGASVEEFRVSYARSSARLIGDIDPAIPVFIDQSFGLPGGEHIRVLDKVFSRRGLSEVYFKAHPKERKSYKRILDGVQTKTNFCLVGDGVSAEEMVAATGVHSVLGFNSTALFNLMESSDVGFILQDYLNCMPLRYYPLFYSRIHFMVRTFNGLVKVFSVDSSAISTTAIRFKRFVGFFPLVWHYISKIKSRLNSVLEEKFEKVGRQDIQSIIKKEKAGFAEKYQGEVDSSLILFESYAGSFSCSPKAIFEFMLQSGRYRDHTFVWAVSERLDDASRASLESHPNVRLVEYASLEYEWYLSVAGTVVSNSRLYRSFVKKPGQFVLQTWHGTPFKQDALSILPKGDKSGSARRIATNDADVSNYSVLLAQNQFSVDKFTKTFDLARHHHVSLCKTGYPRNDVLAQPRASFDASCFKRQFSIPEDKKIILFAPTWRDHHKKKSLAMTRYWDFKRWQEALSEEYHIIFRGHYFFKDAIPFDSYHGFVTDLSGYNDINHLFMASDMLVTDYSSCMFDFSVLGKPMIFFMPDYNAYVRLSRKLHLNPFTELPGPVVLSNDDLLASISDHGNILTKYKSEYADFVSRFNAYDDGCAAERVVALMERETPLSQAK
ncbi:MAG: CDP-glycerol glycerophosphotransferase family protein [Pseudomonadota bacterium]